MSIFNQKSKFKIKTEVRKVKQAVAPTPAKKPTTSSSARASPSLPSSNRTSPLPFSAKTRRAPFTSTSTTSSPESKPLSRTLKRRAPALSASPANASPSFSDSEPGSDDDEDWRDRLDPSKRRKLQRLRASETEDPARRLRHPRLWVGDTSEKKEEGKWGVTHAVEVAKLADGRCQPVMGLGRDEVAVRLRYPGGRELER